MRIESQTTCLPNIRGMVLIIAAFIYLRKTCLQKTHTYKVQKVYRHLFDSVTTMLACLFVCWLGDALLPAKSVKRGSLWSQISWKYIDPKSQNLLQTEHNGTSDGFFFLSSLPFHKILLIFFLNGGFCLITWINKV